MKRLVILVLCVIMCLTGCQFDPYSDQRPPDYGDALWVCDEFDIWFIVDTEKEDYYYPEGELQIGDTTYFCKFYFIHQTNQLHISIYPFEYATIPDASRDRSSAIGTIEGECIFSDDSFVFTIDTVKDNIFNETATQLTFQRITTYE